MGHQRIGKVPPEGQLLTPADIERWIRDMDDGYAWTGMIDRVLEDYARLWRWARENALDGETLLVDGKELSFGPEGEVDSDQKLPF